MPLTALQSRVRIGLAVLILVALVISVAVTRSASADDAVGPGQVLGPDGRVYELSELNSGAASSQGERDREASSEAFGTGTIETVLHASEFQPVVAGTTLTWHQTTYSVYRATSAGSSYLWTQVDLPLGAQLTEVYFNLHDSDGATNVSYWLCYQDFNWFDNTASVSCPYSDSTTGSAGAGDWGLFPSAPGVTMGNPDDQRDRSWLLFVSLDGTGVNSRLYGAKLFWKRQISPAPASARFNDVPTNHQFFREVEALASSGITTGCAAGAYCPDGNVKRSEMAAFLSRALGLHWGQ